MTDTIDLEDVPMSDHADVAALDVPWQLDRWHVDVTFFDEPGYRTTAAARLTAGLDHLDVQGSARKHPADPHDPDVAHVVATARALAELSTRLFEVATACISAWDDEAVPLTH